MKKNTNEITVQDCTYTLCLLSSLEVLEALHLCKSFKAELLTNATDLDETLVDSLCEYGVLLYHCLYQGGEKAFASPLAVLQHFSIDSLCDIYDSYACLLKQTPVYESFVNENFPTV